MEPEGIVEAVVGIIIILILISALSDVIFSIQGRFWGILFIIASIVISVSYLISEI